MGGALAVGNGNMGQLWRREMNGNCVGIVANRSSAQVFLSSLLKFKAEYSLGVVVDAAHNLAEPQVGGERILTDRMRLYAQAKIPHVVVVSRVNHQEIQRLNDLCQSDGIRAVHMPNLVLGMGILASWIPMVQWSSVTSVTIHNTFHAEKPKGPSEGARQLEKIIQHVSPETKILHEFSRWDVPYINRHRLMFQFSEGSLSIETGITARESSLTAIRKMVAKIGDYSPGFHVIGADSLYPHLETPVLEDPSGSLSVLAHQLEVMAKSLGFVLVSGNTGYSQSYRHRDLGETFTIRLLPHAAPIYHKEPVMGGICVVGGGGVGAFTAHHITRLGLPVHWIKGQQPPAAAHSSMNKHYDIIFNRLLNGEMYRMSTLMHDYRNPNSGVDVGLITPTIAWNGLKSWCLSHYNSPEEGERQLTFSRMAKSVVMRFWDANPQWRLAVMDMDRPQLVTRDNEATMRAFYMLLQSRGSAVRWESDLTVLSTMLGTPMGSSVVGAIIHDKSANGQIDFEHILACATEDVLQNGGSIHLDDAILPSRSYLSTGILKTVSGAPFFPQATVLAIGAAGHGVVPLTGVSATIQLPGALQLPTTINRFTFSSTWPDFIRVTSGVMINGRNGELSPKLIRNMARDLSSIPALASDSGIAYLEELSDADFETSVINIGRFVYRMRHSNNCLTGLSVSDGQRQITDIQACMGRPFRAEPVPQVVAYGNVVDAPACHMAGLNWGPFAGAMTARTVQLILREQGIVTPEVLDLKEVKAGFPRYSGHQRWPE